MASIYGYLMSPDERIPEDWFGKQVALADRTDGDIDTLANRIAHIRTWTFVSNRADWLKDPEHWQAKTREIEDRLSDALHEQLTQRFVDARTSALMKGMRDKDELHAEFAADGAIHVENHFVGRLKGFQFQLDPGAEGIHGKATRNAAAQVLARELSMRARRVAAAQPDALHLNRRGRILWREEEIGQIEATDDPLKPTVSLLVDEHLSGPDREKVQARLDAWLAQTIAEKLKPLVEIGKAEDIAGLARGIAYRLRESLGVLRRETVAEEIKSLDQNARAQLRKYGVRFGAFNIYFPILLKPAAAELILTLWSLKNAGANGLSIDALPDAPRAGLTSFNPDPACPEPFYRAYGYHVCGPRAVRLDMLERLADLIRPLLGWRGGNGATPPKGATGDGGFTAIPEMMSLLGCSPDELSGVLKALGFRLDRRPIKVEVVAPAKADAPAAAEGETRQPRRRTTEAAPAPEEARRRHRACTSRSGGRRCSRSGGRRNAHRAEIRGCLASTPACTWRAFGTRPAQSTAWDGNRTPANVPAAQPAAAAPTLPDAATSVAAPAAARDKRSSWQRPAPIQQRPWRAWGSWSRRQPAPARPARRPPPP